MAVITQNSTYKAKIYVGDTFPIRIEHRVASSVSNPLYDNRGEGQAVDSASIMLWSVSQGEYVELGGVGIVEVPCIITAPSGDTGGVITYTIAGTFTQTAGEFAAYISYTYDGGQRTTVRTRFKVASKQ